MNLSPGAAAERERIRLVLADFLERYPDPVDLKRAIEGAVQMGEP